jgi:hypothetical protein
VRLARESNATSLADLIATRLGKDAWLAAGVTLIAVLGLIPYIALQLKAVSMSFALLTDSQAGADQPPWRDSSLYVALVMALFAMLFGTRRASAAEHNRGLVLAMAFESLFKLVAMLALGAVRLARAWDCRGSPPSLPEAAASTDNGGFIPLVLLGVLAMFTLPHQFHVGVVECRDERHVLHRALAVPAVPAADRVAGAAAGARRRCAAGRTGRALRPVRAGAAVVAIAHRAGAVRVPRRTQRGHRHGGGQHAHLEPDDRQPLAGPRPVARRVGARRRRRPARQRAVAAPARHRRDHAAGLGLQPLDRRQ